MPLFQIDVIASDTVCVWAETKNEAEQIAVECACLDDDIEVTDCLSVDKLTDVVPTWYDAIPDGDDIPRNKDGDELTVRQILTDAEDRVREHEADIEAERQQTKLFEEQE